MPTASPKRPRHTGPRLRRAVQGSTSDNHPVTSATPHTPKLQLLRDVSRSFYLSIRVLPAPLRQPVAVGYLLARATDTLADTAQLPAGQRRIHLQTLIDAIRGQPDARGDMGSLAASFAPLQADDGERRLILSLPQCLNWLDKLPPDDRSDVLDVLGKITRGQMLDVERFGDPSQPNSLASARELDEYTYLVAGCVGEFWTALCCRHLHDFAALPLPRMLELGRAYGMGLQLVNILRDQAADLAAGRRYMPQGTTAAHWMDQAQNGLDCGMQYALAVNSRRVRAASALPALIGARTLALIGTQGTSTTKVKVTRSEVRAIALRLLLTAVSRGPLAASYQRLRMGQSQP